jgi:enediyne biosynthesis protein E3
MHRFLKIDEREVEFSRRGFSCANPQIQARLENVGRNFLCGYHAALEIKDLNALAERLEQVEFEQRGFAYEGAAMGLVLLDGFFPRKQRFQAFLHGEGKRHIYMLHVGAGWAYARLPWLQSRIETSIRKLDPVLCWLVIDGFGFHQGYFHGPAALRSCGSHFSEAARHVFYQGLGRSLWFLHGANPFEISQTIRTFDPKHHADAWSGIGIACAYAGGLTAHEIEELRRCAEEFKAALGQGAAFAAKARLLAGNPGAHTQAACEILCGITTDKAAALCDETLTQVDKLGRCPYQQWRKLLQESLLFHTKNQSKFEPALRC